MKKGDKILFYGIDSTVTSEVKEGDTHVRLTSTPMVGTKWEEDFSDYVRLDVLADPESQWERDSEMLFTCPAIFGDEEEHALEMIYRDGEAVQADPDGRIYLTYPKLEEVDDSLKFFMRDYQGIPEPRNYTCRDLALTFGVLHVREA